MGCNHLSLPLISVSGTTSFICFYPFKKVSNIYAQTFFYVKLVHYMHSKINHTKTKNRIKLGLEYGIYHNSRFISTILIFVAARVEDNARYGCGVSEQISTGLATLHVQSKPHFQMYFRESNSLKRVIWKIYFSKVCYNLAFRQLQ